MELFGRKLKTGRGGQRKKEEMKTGGIKSPEKRKTSHSGFA